MGRKFELYEGERPSKGRARRRRRDRIKHDADPYLEDDSAANLAEHIDADAEAPAPVVNVDQLLEGCRTEFAQALFQRLAAAGVVPNTEGLDQHLLVDEDSIRQVVAAGKITKNDSVLEIGPGPGNMTELLLEQCATRTAALSAIELDRRFEGMLTALPHDLRLYWGDAIANFDQVIRAQGVNKVVANIPYKILEPLLRALHTHKQIQRAVLVVGRRYADRVCADVSDSHSDFTTTSLFSQARFNPQVVAYLPRENFIPEPRTESAIVVLDSQKGGARDRVMHNVANAIIKRPNVPTQQIAQNVLGGSKRQGPKRMRGAKAEEMASRTPRVSDLQLPTQVLRTAISQLANHELKLLLSRLDLAQKRSRRS